MEKLRHFSLFSGVESFKKALANLGIDNELVGYSEFDKYASVALSAIHGVSEELNYGDITKIDETKVPDCDLITYGFPCQDISIAGHQKGIVEGETRSGLLYDALRIIKHKKPKYAIAENVKNLVGKKFKDDFNRLLEELEGYGYNNYWKVLNAKDYGIPQNRERVFIVSIRKDVDNGKFEFPKPYDCTLRLKDLLEDEVEEKYCINTERANELIEGLKNGKKGSYPNVEDDPKVTSALGSREHRSSGWKDVVGTLCARDYKDPKVVAEPIIVASRGRNPNNPSDRTTGSPTVQRLEPNSQGICNTLTTVQKDNLVLERTVCEQRSDEGLMFFKDGVAGCLRTVDSCGHKRVLESSELKLDTNPSGENAESEAQINYKLRKLTPKECWRLMGFTDEDYSKARKALEDRFYNGRDRSNSRMYKMAGNSIVVNVLEGIFENLINQ